MEPAPAFDDPRYIKGYGLLYSPTQQAAGLDAPRCIKGYGLLYGGRRPLGAGFDWVAVLYMKRVRNLVTSSHLVTGHVTTESPDR